MTWNHRVVRHKVLPIAGVERPDYLAIHEVYYKDDGTPYMVTKDGVSVGADSASDEESLKDMKETLGRMLRALEHPILNYEDIAGKEHEDDL